MIIVSNTTPLHYLILISEVDLLHELYGQVIIPQAVVIELQRPETPQIVFDWMNSLPAWLEVRTPLTIDLTLKLGAGECEAIALAQELKADQILLDDKKARKAAIERGLSVTGTLNVLDIAAERDLVDLPNALDRLKLTTFRASERLYEELLRLDEQRKRLKAGK